MKYIQYKEHMSKLNATQKLWLFAEFFAGTFEDHFRLCMCMYCVSVWRLNTPRGPAVLFKMMEGVPWRGK